MDPTKWDAPYLVVVAALYVLVLLRSNATYWVGRGINVGGRHTKAARFLDSGSFKRGETLVANYGAPAVALSFLTIGIQTMVNLAAGVARMPLRTYIPATMVGSVAWAFLYATVGFLGFEAISKMWVRNPVLTVAGIAAVVLLIVGYVIVRRRRMGSVDPS